MIILFNENRIYIPMMYRSNKACSIPHTLDCKRDERKELRLKEHERLKQIRRQWLNNRVSPNFDIFAVIDEAKRRKSEISRCGGGRAILWQVHERVSKNGDALAKEQEGASIDPRGDGRLAWKSAPRRLLRRESW